MLEEWEDIKISSRNYLLKHRMDHNVAAGPGDKVDDNDDDDDDDDDTDDDDDEDDKNLPTPALQWTTTGESGEGFAAAEFLKIFSWSAIKNQSLKIFHLRSGVESATIASAISS